MQTLYIKLVPLDKRFVELRYAFKEPIKYEVQRLDIASIDDLIQKAKGGYYMLLPDLKGIGQQLFCWLDGSGRWLSRAINECEGEGLALALDVRERLGHLPWETLHDENQFLVDRINPVVVPIRWSDRATKELSKPEQRPLRILFMATSPEKVQPSLDFEQEEAQILAATQNIPLDLRVEESGCIEELGNFWKRYREPFDVFHLTGHASIKDEQPFFLTETETGECHIAYASEIAEALRFRMPQLIFLSGCRTGEAPSNGAVSSLAEGLIEQGCRAVLGWGRPIADVVATQAAAHLYSELAAGYKLTEAIASTYQYLRQAKVDDWHLLRLYVGGQCLKALVEPFGDQVWLPEAPIHEYFLDSQGIVRVASREEFVGRRRTLQRSLKALRTAEKLGLILHGLGGVGKSTIAARLLERLQGYDKVFIYQQLDEDKLLKQLAEQCLSETGQQILQGQLPLAQKLTKFLREGLNEPAQRFIFILDDFEANLEFRADGNVVLKPEVVSVLMALLKAIVPSKLPHRVIITSRYNFPLPELDQKFHREQINALFGADLQKKCSRLAAFAPGSVVDKELQLKALETSAGNPRLLEWLDKVLQTQHLNQDQILEQVKSKSEELREIILGEELLNRQPLKMQRMLSYCLVYQLPVPISAIKVLCPKTFDVNTYVSKAVDLGLLECNHSYGETLYFVPHILKSENLLKLPEDSIELYKVALEHLHEIWFVGGLTNSLNERREQSKKVEFLQANDYFEKSIPTDRLFELYRLATEGLNLGVIEELNLEVLMKANWFLVMRLDSQKRYREVIKLCEFVMHGAFGHLGIHLSPIRSLFYLAKAQEYTGAVEEAINNYKIVLRELPSDTAIDEVQKASILHNLADLYEGQGKYQEALKYCLQALKIDQYMDNDLGKAKSYNVLANIKRGLGEKEEALETYKQALEFAEECKDNDLTRVIQVNIARLEIELGRVSTLEDITSILSSGTQSENVEIRIACLNNLAALEKLKGNKAVMEIIYQQLTDLLPEIENLWYKASILHNVATFQSDSGKHELALEWYFQALELHRLNQDQKHEAMTLQEIGILHERLGKPEEALEYLENAYQLSLEINDNDNQAYILAQIASILIDQDRFQEASIKLDLAHSILAKTNHSSHHALVLKEMGRLQGEQKNFVPAASLLRQALEKCNIGVDIVLRANILKLLGQVLIQLGEIDEAVKHLRERRNICQQLNSLEEVEEVDRLIQEAYLWKPAQLYQAALAEAEKGNTRAAIDSIEQALPIIEQLGEKEIQARLLISLGNLLIDEGEITEGLKKTSESIRLAKQHDLPKEEELENAAQFVQCQKLKMLFDVSHEKCENGEFDEALILVSQCLELAESLQDNDCLSYVLARLGQIKIQQDDYDSGIQDLQKAVSLVREHQLDGIEELQELIQRVNTHKAIHLYEEASSTAQQGQLERGIELAEKAYDFQCSVNYQLAQPATLALLGQLLALAGRLPEGLEKLYSALAIAEAAQAQELMNQIQERISVLTELAEGQDVCEEQL